MIIYFYLKIVIISESVFSILLVCKMFYLMGDVFFVILDKLSGLFVGVKVGIVVGVLLLFGLCGGVVVGWFYRKKKGNYFFDY